MEEKVRFASVPVKQGAPKKHKHNRWVWSPWQEEYGALFIFSLVHPVNFFLCSVTAPQNLRAASVFRANQPNEVEKKNEQRQSLRTALRRDCRCWFFFGLLGATCSKYGGCTYVLRRNPSFESKSSEWGRQKKKKERQSLGTRGPQGLSFFFFFFPT